jgi:hypothetical protein
MADDPDDASDLAVIITQAMNKFLKRTGARCHKFLLSLNGHG